METPSISNQLKAVTILMADDDADDRLLAGRAFANIQQWKVDLQFVEDGVELMDYLYRRDKYRDAVHRLPQLILLDLNMPRKNGWEVLEEIKADPELKKIPIVILTTSEAEEDVINSYNKGVNSYITKPVSFEQLVKVAQALGNYWFDTVKLPQRP